VEGLEEWVFILLTKNQTLRMALQAKRAGAQGSGYLLRTTADSFDPASGNRSRVFLGETS